MEVLPELRKGCDNFRCYRSKRGAGLSDEVASKLPESVDLDRLDSVKDCPEPESVTKSISANDPLLFIYTSGTTGLPKAVIIKHIRYSFFISRSSFQLAKFVNLFKDLHLLRLSIFNTFSSFCMFCFTIYYYFFV